MIKVKEIIDFFCTSVENGTAKSLDELMRTIPGYVHMHEQKGAEEMNWTMAQEYYRICQKMCDDLLLVNVKHNNMICIANEYIAVPSGVNTNPDIHQHKLDTGFYDFKYRGFPYIYEHFKGSVVPIVGIKPNGNDDIGTAYYIGDHMFVTAAHCITDLQKFKLLKGDGTLKLKEVWFAKDQDTLYFDLAVIVIDDDFDAPSFDYWEPCVLDEVMVMGYPPIPNLYPVLTAETASVGAYLKSSIGQVVGDTTAYRSNLDSFLITARVKGGNSGGPVINCTGQVVGTVVEIPFDSLRGSDTGRYDIMGYGICLPAKYTKDLMENPDKCMLINEVDYFKVSV